MPELSSHWSALEDARQRLSQSGIALRFEQDPKRSQRWTLGVGPLRADLSRNLLDQEAWEQLLALAVAAGVPDGIARMFAGSDVNSTERRPALHAALRNPDCARQAGVAEEVMAMQQKMYAIADQVAAGRWLGATGQPVTDFVNIGIGGSDLGPRMVVRALGAQGAPVRVHFLANIDGQASHELLRKLNPATTLFAVTSKSFGTRETLTNATTARDWLSAGLGQPPEALSQHFLAVSANVERAVEFGVKADHVLPMWDWVGGRYSLWSGVGLPIAVAIGSKGFADLLAGAAQMDDHFKSAPLVENLPVLQALLGIWHRNVCAMDSYAMVPYDQRLEYLPAWLQQLDMESNGKSVSHDGDHLERDSGPICWGGVGTDGQHAYFQWLHQGSSPTPVEFVAVRQPDHPYPGHHRQLLANMLGQATALMRGRNTQETRRQLQMQGHAPQVAAQLAPHMTFPGNRPSTVIMLDRLTPQSLGSLLALHEHRVYTQSLVWGNNAFDQWGVELGKTLSLQVEQSLETGATSDPTLDQWLAWLRESC